MAKGHYQDGTPFTPPGKKSKGDTIAITTRMHLFPGSVVQAQKNSTRYVELLVIKDQIGGVFNRRELTGLVAALNGVMVEFPSSIPAKDMLLGEIEDACILENNDKLYRYSSGDLLEKIRGLSDFQAGCLLLALTWFWEKKVANGDLETFLSAYATNQTFAD